MQIKFDKVSYIYNENTPFQFKALSGIDLEIQPGKLTAIIGKTGSGKSTIAQHVNGLLLPTKGKVFVDDFVLSSEKSIRSKNYKQVRKTVGLVFQFPEYQLFEDTVKKDIEFGPKNFGVKDEELGQIVNESINLVGLDKSYLNRSPFELSGGEKRRVAIAGILACKPSVLVVDEPTAGLDPSGCKNLMIQLRSLIDKGITVIVITHDMEAVIRYADNVVVMENGKVSFIGNPITLFSGDVSLHSLDTPNFIDFAKKLNSNGFHINLHNLKGISSLVDEIKRGYK